MRIQRSRPAAAAEEETDLQRMARERLEKLKGGGAKEEPVWGKLPPTDSLKNVQHNRDGSITYYARAPQETRMYLAVRIYGQKPVWVDPYEIIDNIAAEAEAQIEAKLGQGVRCVIRLVYHTAADMTQMVEAPAGSIISGKVKQPKP